MANWCETTYTLVGESAKRLNDIIDKIQTENHADKNWLGNIITALGGNPDELYCRGWIENYGMNGDGSLTLYCTTAWGELTEWRDFVNEKLECAMSYRAEEPGNGIFITNDNSFPPFKVETNCDTFYCDDLSELNDTVCDYLGIFPRKLKDDELLANLHELVDKFNEEHPHGDEFIYLDEFEYED